jgi:hypothetical protein
MMALAIGLIDALYTSIPLKSSLDAEACNLLTTSLIVSDIE